MNDMEYRQNEHPVIHEMRLREPPFRAVASGRKTIEMRLCDEKRQALRVGDTIRFTLEGGSESVTSEVIALHAYPNFEELYAALIPTLGKAALGYADTEDASPDHMLAYYSAEDVRRYGVVGIEIKQKANHDHGI